MPLGLLPTFFSQVFGFFTSELSLRSPCLFSATVSHLPNDRMNDLSNVTNAKTTLPRAKSSVTKFDIGVYVTLVLLAVFLISAWYQSRISPYFRTWANPSIRAGSRTISADGRFLWQRCDVTKLRGPDGASKLSSNVVVGSNPNGARTPIQCGDVEVSFSQPPPDRWFGFESSSTAYPAMMLILLAVLVLCLVEAVAKALIRRSRESCLRSNPSEP